MQELIPFAKEILSHKPSWGLLKVYLIGSMFAVLGTVIALVEAVCHPFFSGEPMDAEMVFMLAWEQKTIEAEKQHYVGGDDEEEEEEKKGAHESRVMTQSMTLSKKYRPSQRSMANRLHAS